MDKMNYPRGLIRYSTQNAVSNKWGRPEIMQRVFRPRTILYGVVLLALTVGLLVSLVLRTPLKVDIVRDRAALSRIVSGGKLENVYRLQIMNATEKEQTYVIQATGLEGIEVASEQQVVIEPAQSRWVPVRLQIPYGAVPPGSHTVYFAVGEAGGGAHVSEKSVFLVPR
jgi:polyferredoxin